MNRILLPGPRRGQVKAPASKSMAHRLLICAALGQKETRLRLSGFSGDLAATAACLEALGARIERSEEDRFTVTPIGQAPAGRLALPCGESGATLRFLLPLAGALGAEAVFHREGRLPARPLESLTEELRRHGMNVEERGADLYCSGKLQAGEYRISGEQSSQFASGLLMALPHLEGESGLRITGTLASSSYLAMTEDVLKKSGIRYHKHDDGYRIPGGQSCALPRELVVEGDWSAAAAFLCMGALSPEGIAVAGLNLASLQGDREIVPILRRFGAELRESADTVLARRGERRPLRIDGNQTPDLVPVLAALSASAEGETRIENAARSRWKESDRLHSAAELIRSLGGSAEEELDELHVFGGGSLRGGSAESFSDHRIAMAVAVAASFCREPVTIRGADCVEKSYPNFWNDWESLEAASV